MLDEYLVIDKLNEIEAIQEELKNNTYKSANQFAEALKIYYSKLPDDIWTNEWKPRVLHDLVIVSGYICSDGGWAAENKFLAALGKRWEKTCSKIASKIFDKVLLQPKLPNNKIPDIAINPAVIRKKEIEFAEVLIDCKLSLLNLSISPNGILKSKEIDFYAGYCTKIEYWVLEDSVWCNDYLKDPRVSFRTYIDIERMAGNKEFVNELRSLKDIKSRVELMFLEDLCKKHIDKPEHPFLEVILKQQKELEKRFTKGTKKTPFKVLLERIVKT